MRIAHFMPNIWEPGGIASYIARVGAMQQADGHQVLYLDYEAHRSATTLADRETHYVSDDADLLAATKRLSLDLLHTHTLVNGLERVPVPCVRTVHGHQPFCPSASRFLKRWSKPCDRAYSPLGCAWGHFVDHCGSIRPAEFLAGFARTKQEMKGLSAVWVTTDSDFIRTQMLRSGYDPSRIVAMNMPVPETARAVPLTKDGLPRMLYAGRIVPSKGVDSLIKALRHVRTDVKLDIAGSGPHEENIRKLIRRENLESRVTLHGWCDSSRVDELLREARALIFPSIWHEPGGTSAFEAMMQARPVICSRVGGMPEVVIHGETGLLYPPGDEKALAAAIDQLAGSWEQAARLGTQAREYVMSRYTLRLHVDQLAKVYDTCIADFASRRKAGRDSLPEGAADAAALSRNS
jgi:glycosyltransferase involved in cell wall biosynthesis